jgi:splicing factor 1
MSGFGGLPRVSGLDGSGTPREPRRLVGSDLKYASLMAELGEDGKNSGGGGVTLTGAMGWNRNPGNDMAGGGSNVLPWRRPEVWSGSGPQGYDRQSHGG